LNYILTFAVAGAKVPPYPIGFIATGTAILFLEVKLVISK
jgi:hypothetical protein